MVIEFAITFSDGTERQIRYDPDEATLDQLETLEALQDKEPGSIRLRDIIPVLAILLGLSEAEARQIKRRDFQAILDAMRSAGTIDPTSG